MKNKYVITLLSSALLCSLTSFVCASVTINEFMASNGHTLSTKSGVVGFDWVELKNSSDEDIDVTGWYLHDKLTAKQSKWSKIEGHCIVPANGYAIVWAEKDFTGFTSEEAFSKIGLSTDGEDLFLAKPDGEIVSSLTFNKQIKDVSCGKNSSGEWVYFRTPTPLEKNADEGFTSPTPEVQFSVSHGYKTEPFELVISCADSEAATIHYTLDGSSPSASSPTYEKPIPITSTTVVRAAVPDARSILQSDASATYIFVEDVLTQGTKTPKNFPASGVVNKQKMYYGMNATIVKKYRDKILRGFTNSIDTISIVIDPAHLFDKTTGIYVNAKNDGREWERYTMMELISPTNSSAGFSVPAGLRIRGAYSRNPQYPKHSLRFFFRSEYGMGSLDYRLFEKEGVKKFDKIDLRTSQNNSWANNDSYSSQATFIEECFARDSQRDLGEPYNRSRYYHLFINGIYWGLYITEERVSQDYGETNFGGSADDYDVVRTSYPGYVTSVVEGEDASWRKFWGMSVNEGYGSKYPNNYLRAQGLNPDGTRNPEYPIYLNVRNVITYMLTSHFIADRDTPTSVYGFANNIAAFYNRAGSGSVNGWIFNYHDAEHSLGKHLTKVSDNKTLTGTDASNKAFAKLENFNPAELHYKLTENSDYRSTFSAFVEKECVMRGGAFTPKVARARFLKRMNEIDDAVACESARWGYGKWTYETWKTACDASLAFIDKRLTYLIPHYRASGLYSGTDLVVEPYPEGAVALRSFSAFDKGANRTVTFDTEKEIYRFARTFEVDQGVSDHCKSVNVTSLASGYRLFLNGVDLGKINSRSKTLSIPSGAILPGNNELIAELPKEITSPLSWDIILYLQCTP